MTTSPPPPPSPADGVPPAEPRPASEPEAAAASDRELDPLRSSRTSGAWTGVIAAAVLLVLLVVFVVQNTESVPIEFLGWDGNAPLAAALLISVAVGMAIVALVGSLRIVQLRRRVKRERRLARRS